MCDVKLGISDIIVYELFKKVIRYITNQEWKITIIYLALKDNF